VGLYVSSDDSRGCEWWMVIEAAGGGLSEGEGPVVGMLMSCHI